MPNPYIQRMVMVSKILGSSPTIRKFTRIRVGQDAWNSIRKDYEKSKRIRNLGPASMITLDPTLGPDEFIIE